MLGSSESLCKLELNNDKNQDLAAKSCDFEKSAEYKKLEEENNILLEQNKLMSKYRYKLSLLDDRLSVLLELLEKEDDEFEANNIKAEIDNIEQQFNLIFLSLEDEGIKIPDPGSGPNAAPDLLPVSSSYGESVISNIEQVQRDSHAENKEFFLL